VNYESNKIYSDFGGGRSVVVRVLQEEGRGSASQRGEIAAGSGNGKGGRFLRVCPCHHDRRREKGGLRGLLPKDTNRRQAEMNSDLLGMGDGEK